MSKCDFLEGVSLIMMASLSACHTFKVSEKKDLRDLGECVSLYLWQLPSIENSKHEERRKGGGNIQKDGPTGPIGGSAPTFDTWSF